MVPNDSERITNGVTVVNAHTIATIVRSHLNEHNGNVTRMTAWLTAHATLGNVRSLNANRSLFQANFDVECYCCGAWVNGSMISLDHVANDGCKDIRANGERLSGSKLAEAWFRAHKNGEQYHTQLRSCCGNCQASKNANGGECLCQAAQNRR